MAPKLPSKWPLWLLLLISCGTGIGLSMLVLIPLWLATETSPKSVKAPPAAIPISPEPAKVAQSPLPESSPSQQTSDLSPYAQAQVDVSRAYLDKTLGHIQSAKKAALEKDISTSCQEFKNAESSGSAVFISIKPVARELQVKRPEMMSTIMANGRDLAASIETALAECRRIGLI